MNYYFKEYEQPVLLTNHLNMGGANPQGERIDVTSQYFTKNGLPWIGIMGEFHFNRYHRDDWYEELCKMKAGGITIVSTYLFWIYHEEIEGEFCFWGDNDIRSFILEAKRAGLDVVIRIGPWAHGECRNGGFPDWLLKKPFKIREDNEAYLDLVRKWYSQIAKQVEGLFYKDGGNIVAIQIENELVNNAAHLATLKNIAIECGMEAPLYTVTGWNQATGACIPVDEVVPVFGGYCEAPWTGHTKKLPPSVNYFFNQMRNDSAIGSDLELLKGNQDDGWQLPYERYPYATCELGGGIQVTYHRRPIISGMDIYALSMVKLGSGNNLAGYYMYHGGTNKIGKRSTLQESKETGYPNDVPILSYDFQTALSEYGEVREQYRLLNLMHLFIQDFDQLLAPMNAVDAKTTIKREDTTSLRYAMRTNGEGGFVFVNHYQRLDKLADVEDVVIHTDKVIFPSMDIRGDISFFLPFHLDLSGEFLEYATAQLLCREEDTYFFVEIPGIPAQYKFRGQDALFVKGGMDSKLYSGEISIVTLTWEEALYLRKLDGVLYLGQGCDLYKKDGKVLSVEDGEFVYFVWNQGEFKPYPISQPKKELTVYIKDIEEAPFIPAYVKGLHLGGESPLRWKKIEVSSPYGFVTIDDCYDVGQIYADRTLVADSFYYGQPWRVPAKLLYGKETYLVMSSMKDTFYKEF